MSKIVTTKVGRFRSVTRDGRPCWLWECPGCGQWGELDDDQWNGRVSVDCAGTPPGCKGGYHETHNFGAELAAAMQSREQKEP